MSKISRLMMRLAAAGGCAALVLASGLSARADTAQDFYKGKTLTLVVSTQEGGSTDSTARITAKFMSHTIPGDPNIIVRNMPGAGHLRATAYMYSQAPADGSSFAVIWRSFVMHQVIDGRNTKFDSAKFDYIGSTGASNSTVFVWHTAGVDTLNDAMKKEVIMGGTGSGSDTVLYPTLLNKTVNTKFKIVTGYKGGSAIDLAMQRGEVQGRAGSSFSGIVAKHADWIAKKRINILVQIGEKPDPDFKGVPMLTSFAMDAKTKELFELFSYGVALGRPFLAPPKVPADRLAALRAAFQAAVKDPALMAEFKKARIDLSPISGERLTEMVASMVNVNDEVKASLNTLMPSKKKK